MRPHATPDDVCLADQDWLAVFEGSAAIGRPGHFEYAVSALNVAHP